MKAITVTQGSPEWAALRAQYNTASEAPVMMGASKYQTRDELLRQKATGIVPEVGRQQQALFDRGHATEAAARLILEEMTGEDFYPITAVSDDGTLLASVDGITMDDSTNFEHKLYNESLAARVRAGDLEPHYYWQLEQQLLVTGAEKVIFVCSDGTRENWSQMEYLPVPGRAEQLVAGWAQFDADKAAYTPTEAAPVVVAAAVTALPAVSVQVTGSIAIKDNFAAFEVALKDFIENRLIRKPETDQDFADLDTQIKALKGAESALDALEAQMLSQVEPVDMAKRTKDMLLKMARENRLMAEKLLAARKDQIKVEQVQRGQKALAEHIAALNTRLGKPYMPAVTADFAAAIKGLRTVDSLKNAVDTLLANVKISSSATADLIQSNLATLRELAAKHAFLFSDTATIVLKANDDLTALVKTRIADHKAAELVREEATRERIRAEEQAKAEAAARAKVLAEQDAERAEAQRTSAIQAQAEKVAADFAAQQNAPQIIQKIMQAAPTKCDGNHGGPQCADPECWNGGVPQGAASVPAANVVHIRAAAPVVAASPATPPTMKLGDINAHLSPITLTAEGLTKLNFPPAATDKNAKLYHARDLTHICAALHDLLDQVQAKQAA